jgi:hypothetical protein
MTDTLIQTIERTLGREVPTGRQDQKFKSAAKEYRETLAEQREADNAEMSGSSISNYDSGIVGLMTQADSAPLAGFAIGLAVLVAILSVMVFKLSARIKRMKHSKLFESEAIGKMSVKYETLLWFRRLSPADRKYKAFLKDLRVLVEDHKAKGNIEISLNEGWRDK